MSIVHAALKIRSKYSQKLKCAASFLVSALMYLWAIYIFRRSVCLFCCIAFADRSWEYINRSQTVECRNWERGRPVSFLGIFVSNFRNSAFALHIYKAGTTLGLFIFQIQTQTIRVNSTFVFRYLLAAEDTIRILLQKVINTTPQL